VAPGLVSLAGRKRERPTGDDAVDDVAADADALVVVDDLLDAVVALGLYRAGDARHVALDLALAVEHAVIRVHPCAFSGQSSIRNRGRGRTVARDNESLDRACLPFARRAHDAARSAHRCFAVLVAREAVGGDPAVVGAVAGHFGLVVMMMILCGKRGSTQSRLLGYDPSGPRAIGFLRSLDNSNATMLGIRGDEMLPPSDVGSAG
jgi:hypothetical protein